MEQILHLQWQGKYGLDNKKYGKWRVSWQSNVIKEVGGYYLNGLKQGLWKELYKNYQTSDAKVFEFGEYYNDLKRSKWNYIYKNKKIGGGLQNIEGLKKGKWTELSENFCYDSQVIYNGEYNKKGMKVGIWDIMYCVVEENQYKQIGGGLYHCSLGIKIGKWVELWDSFYLYSQACYKGHYNMKGMKVGRWDIMFCDNYEKEYQQIGGGSYDDSFGSKIGQWVELDEGFYADKQVTYDGKYNLNGIKVGNWITKYCKFHEKEYKQIGGGSYDSFQGFKIGRWIELDQGFYEGKQITYNGEYNINGIKVGRWDIMLCHKYGKEYQQIGGGQYDNYSGRKIGQWVELDEELQGWNYITYSGKYNMNGKKVGKWRKIDLRSNNNFGKYEI
ncbi:unnamed protein product [Paramecium sonneborni]|uniref:Uncharacterized protein n=1 Tax=Paramecium sonneborni TaxID=65129 RepID=A0A8S1QWW9_9CILI|nr:unnamed protein product [Paramecium sonneborni]